MPKRSPDSKVAQVGPTKTYGKLTVFKRVERCDGAGKGDSGWYWQCRCECGLWCEVRADRLAFGNTRSCGCLGIVQLRRKLRAALTVFERAQERRLAHINRQSALAPPDCMPDQATIAAALEQADLV